MSLAPPNFVPPMLATLVSGPFRRKGWIFEEKYDGYRILARRDRGRVTLFSRNGLDRTSRFVTIARALARLPGGGFLLDGEAVVLDRRGISHFQLLQEGRGAPVYAVFDCLFAGGRDLRREPLSARRSALEVLVGRATGVTLSRRLSKDGLAAFLQARRHGFEGLVAKDESSPYVSGRSRLWQKVKIHREEEFVVGGYTPPRGSRAHFGALLLGAYRGRKLAYVGKVGTGFSRKTLSDLARRLAGIVRRASPFADPPREKGAVWVAPRIVVEIGFQEWTADGMLRQARYLGLRDDKAARDVSLPRPS
jgi:bifunctional non-homologous end joining protein LigD